MAMLGVVVLGTALVAFSWNARDVEALSPSFNDHWHIPYGIYDCTAESFQIPLENPNFPTHSGIHTHSDGVVHAHPFSSAATGRNATVGTFLDATTAQFDGDESLTFADRPELAAGADCGGEEAILQIARFDAFGATEPIEVVTEDLEDFRFLEDLQMFTIALAPAGADIPPPPQAAQDAAAASSPNIFDTTDLSDLDSSLNSAGIGFNEDGQLVDANEEPIRDPETDEIITFESIQAEAGDGEDTDDE